LARKNTAGVPSIPPSEEHDFFPRVLAQKAVLERLKNYTRQLAADFFQRVSRHAAQGAESSD
jgi:hypothetical protein